MRSQGTISHSGNYERVQFPIRSNHCCRSNIPTKLYSHCDIPRAKNHIFKFLTASMSVIWRTKNFKQRSDHIGLEFAHKIPKQKCFPRYKNQKKIFFQVQVHSRHLTHRRRHVQQNLLRQPKGQKRCWCGFPRTWTTDGGEGVFLDLWVSGGPAVWVYGRGGLWPLLLPSHAWGEPLWAQISCLIWWWNKGCQHIFGVHTC